MATFVPKFKLYNTDGITLIYTFPLVQTTNAPKPTKKSVVIEGIRGQGCIIIPGSDASWDLTINGIFMDEDYEAITARMEEINNNIVFNTPYILKIDKSPSTTFIYNVKRIIPIEYPESLRTTSQQYLITLKVGAW